MLSEDFPLVHFSRLFPGTTGFLRAFYQKNQGIRCRQLRQKPLATTKRERQIPSVLFAFPFLFPSCRLSISLELFDSSLKTPPCPIRFKTRQRGFGHKHRRRDTTTKLPYVCANSSVSNDSLSETAKIQGFTVLDSGCKDKRKRANDESPSRDTISKKSLSSKDQARSASALDWC